MNNLCAHTHHLFLWIPNLAVEHQVVVVVESQFLLQSLSVHRHAWYGVQAERTACEADVFRYIARIDHTHASLCLFGHLLWELVVIADQHERDRCTCGKALTTGYDSAKVLAAYFLQAIALRLIQIGTILADDINLNVLCIDSRWSCNLALIRTVDAACRPKHSREHIIGNLLVGIFTCRVSVLQSLPQRHLVVHTRFRQLDIVLCLA